jgi:hypothetical protein
VFGARRVGVHGRGFASRNGRTLRQPMVPVISLITRGRSLARRSDLRGKGHLSARGLDCSTAQRPQSRLVAPSRNGGNRRV